MFIRNGMFLCATVLSLVLVEGEGAPRGIGTQAGGDEFSDSHFHLTNDIHRPRRHTCG